MIKKTLYFDEGEWEQAKRRSEKEGFSLASVIRALLKLWLRGEIKIEV